MIFTTVVSLLLIQQVVVLVEANHDSSLSNLRGSSSQTTVVNTRVIGGNNIEHAGVFPYFVLLHGNFVCGGVLIAPSLVLTAAHVSFLCLLA